MPHSCRRSTDHGPDDKRNRPFTYYYTKVVQVEGLCTFASSAIRHFSDLMLAGGALLRRHVREGRGKGNAWLPVRLLVVAALGNLGNRMLHLLLPSQPQVRGRRGP